MIMMVMVVVMMMIGSSLFFWKGIFSVNAMVGWLRLVMLESKKGKNKVVVAFTTKVISI